MTTLAIALAQSPIRAAWTEATHGVIEVRALATEQAAMRSQATWTHRLRYELLSGGQPQMIGSYSEMTALVAHLRGPHGAHELDWQPCWFPGQ